MTGAVTADVSRNVPVISLASGRVVELRARLGDTVQKGQLLMRIQSADLPAPSPITARRWPMKSGRAQLDRSKLLYRERRHRPEGSGSGSGYRREGEGGCGDGLEHLRVLGADIDHPSALVDIFAPASGVITEQNVTARPASRRWTIRPTCSPFRISPTSG